MIIKAVNNSIFWLNAIPTRIVHHGTLSGGLSHAISSTKSELIAVNDVMPQVL